MASISFENVNASDLGLDLSSFFEGRKAFPKGTKSVLRAINHYLTRQRQGTAKAKTRGEVRGGGKKPFKQKGTGNARQGSRRSPLIAGGGTSHGPNPRPWNPKNNKKEARLAFKAAIADLLNADSVFKLKNLDESGKKSGAWRGVFHDDKKTLILCGAQEGLLGARNFPETRLANSMLVNTYDLVWADQVVFAEVQDIENVKARLGK